MLTRSGLTSMLEADSTTSWIVFIDVHTPAKRLIANACRPRSRMSCTLDGKNTGRPQALKMWSLWCAAVLLLATWSSPATAITPPCGDGAGEVGVLEHVGAAVDARALAVPDAEHAVVLLVGLVELELLRAPQRGGGELFVDARLEHHVVGRQVLARRPQRLVIAAERRAAVAADEAGGVEPVLRIAHALQHRQTHQRLHAAHEGAAGFERVLVVERDGFQRLANRLGQRGIHREASPVRRL